MNKKVKLFIAAINDVKNKIFLFCSGFLVLIICGCKYDQTCSGTYTGDYTAYSIPGFSNTYGTGTFAIDQKSSTSTDIKFSSAGNPDVNFNDMPTSITRSADGTTWHFEVGHYTGPQLIYGYVYEHHYTGKSWVLDFNYSDSSYASIHFNGSRN